ncbi:MAG TPA: LacI family DNA-binding transcriptional regulator [Sphingobacterium sp.]|nr:LacI family DNA-binding transcriptional regulator [Sphingobacterium sp.]
MKKRILISDIARAMGVSITTVSFVLNGKAEEKRISEEVTNRILAYVEKVGYKPNQLAKSLRSGETKLLGLLVEDIGNPFFANVAKHIEKEAYKNDYHIIYCSIANDDNRAKELIDLFYDRHIDGFIITPTDNLSPTVRMLIQSKIPTILFDRYLTDVETNYVVSDNFKAAYDATKHLLENKNHQKVGLVSLYSNQTQMRDRMEGYRKAIDESRLQNFIQKISLDEDMSNDIMHDFIVGNQLDAVLFSTNYLTISALKSSKEKNFTMPKFISFDEHTLFNLYEPSITSISQNIKEIAHQLIKVLIKQISSKDEPIRQVVVPCELKIRASSL